MELEPRSYEHTQAHRCDRPQHGAAAYERERACCCKEGRRSLPITLCSTHERFEQKQAMSWLCAWGPPYAEAPSARIFVRRRRMSSKCAAPTSVTTRRAPSPPASILHNATAWDSSASLDMWMCGRCEARSRTRSQYRRFVYQPQKSLHLAAHRDERTSPDKDKSVRTHIAAPRPLAKSSHQRCAQPRKQHSTGQEEAPPTDVITSCAASDAPEAKIPSTAFSASEVHRSHLRRNTASARHLLSAGAPRRIAYIFFAMPSRLTLISCGGRLLTAAMWRRRQPAMTPCHALHMG